jgi:hypothetical protein
VPDDAAATQTIDPAAEDEAQPSESPEASASQEGATPGDISPESRAQMNSLIRGLAGQPSPGLTSNSGDQDDEESDDQAQDGASASNVGDVNPPGEPSRPLGRRGSAREIERLNGEVERLNQALNALNPPQPDPSETARAAATERETRYRRLLVKPESDADWTHEDIQFLETEKQRRALFPEVQRQHEAALAADREALRREYEGAWGEIKRDLSSTLSLPGVTDEVKTRLLAAPLSEQILMHRRLEREALEPEIRKRDEEIAALKRDLYGATRAPISAGRSSPGRTYSENDLMNTLIRGGRR